MFLSKVGVPHWTWASGLVELEEARADRAGRVEVVELDAPPAPWHGPTQPDGRHRTGSNVRGLRPASALWMLAEAIDAVEHDAGIT